MRRFALPVAMVLLAIASCTWAVYELTKGPEEDISLVPVESNRCPFQGREGFERSDPRCVGARVEVGEAVCTSLRITKLARDSFELAMTGVAVNADVKSAEYVVWNVTSPWRVIALRDANPEGKKGGLRVSSLSPGLYLVMGNVTDTGRKVTPPCVDTFSVQ